jgi:chromosome segregation ATPase
MMANAKQVQETLDEARRLNVELTQTREIVKEINGSVPQLNKAIENSTKSTRGRLDEVNNSLKTQNDSAQKELSKGLEDLTTAQAGTKKDLLKEVDNAKTSLITDYTGKFKIVNDSLNRMSLDARTTKEDLTGRLGSTKEQLDRNKADTDKIKMDLASAIAEISRFKGQFETTQKTLADLQRDVKNHGQALTKFAKDDLGPLISSISTLTDKVNQLVKASVTPQPPKSAGP